MSWRAETQAAIEFKSFLSKVGEVGALIDTALRTLRVNATNPKNRLRDIETNCCEACGPSSTHIHGAHAPVEEPSTASTVEAEGYFATRSFESWVPMKCEQLRSRVN